MPYTAERSRAIAFGSTMIEFGEGVTLAMLARQSATSHRAVPIPIALGATTELGRFPATPYPLVTGPDGMRRAPAVVRSARRGETAVAKRDSEAASHRTPQGSRPVRARLSHQLRECCADNGRTVPFPRTGVRLRHLHVARGRTARDPVRLPRRPRVGRIRGRGPGQGDPHHRWHTGPGQDSCHWPQPRRRHARFGVGGS